MEVRLNAPAGTLIGGPVELVPPAPPAQTEPTPDGAAPTAGMVLGADLEPPTRIPLAPTSGMHDVYLVFHNPEAQRSDALMLLRSIEFLRPEEAAQ